MLNREHSTQQQITAVELIAGNNAWKHINERYNVVHPRTIPEEDSSSTEDGEKHAQRMKTLRERSRVHIMILESRQLYSFNRDELMDRMNNIIFHIILKIHLGYSVIGYALFIYVFIIGLFVLILIIIILIIITTICLIIIIIKYQ